MIVISENNAKKIIDLIDNRIFSLQYANYSSLFKKHEIKNLEELKESLIKYLPNVKGERK
ncbi:MAG TPA: hypothetical protein GX692_04895 [Acholeplasmataceae bacterium]|nr:hypothetical protein [Acholeplasmataceae bacterium]